MNTSREHTRRELLTSLLRRHQSFSSTHVASTKPAAARQNLLETMPRPTRPPNTTTPYCAASRTHRRYTCDTQRKLSPLAPSPGKRSNESSNKQVRRLISQCFLREDAAAQDEDEQSLLARLILTRVRSISSGVSASATVKRLRHSRNVQQCDTGRSRSRLSYFRKASGLLREGSPNHRRAGTLMRQCDTIQQECREISRSQKSIKRGFDTSMNRIRSTIDRDLTVLNTGTTESLIAEVIKSTTVKLDRLHIRRYFGFSSHYNKQQH